MKPSSSRLGHALRMLVKGVLATSAILVPTATASAADTETPALTAFSVSDTQVTPGQQVTFSYVATDDSGTLSRLLLGYVSDIGLIQTLTFDGPLPVAGSTTTTVPTT